MDTVILPKTLIVVPAFNEEASIASTLSELTKLKKQLKNLEVCVVNDGSTDKTKEIISEFDIIALNLPQNLGIGGAVQTGYKYAYNQGFEIAIQFDADGQHNAEDLLQLIDPLLKQETDMVIGSRFLKKTDYKGSKARRVGIYYFYLILKLLTKQKFTDPTSGYRAINANVIELFARNYPKDYPEPEVLVLLHKKGMRAKEITVNMKERQGGESSITPLKSVYYMGKVTLSILMQKIVKE